MPVYTLELSGGAEFTGADENTGLLAPGIVGRFQRVLIRSVFFETSAAISTWSLTVLNTAGTEIGKLYADTTTAFSLFGGADGVLVLPAADGQSYQLKFTSSGITGDSSLTIDYDILQGKRA
jgi:hypothetical protein